MLTLEQLVQQRVRECQNQIKEKTGILLDPITIRLDLKEQIAGQAILHHGELILRINSKFFKTAKYEEEMLVRVIPHEMCHLLAFYKHGRNGAGHGRFWRSYMTDIFRLFPYPTHIMGQENIWQFDEKRT